MSTENGTACKTVLDPTPGFLVAQFCTRRKTRGGLDLARSPDMKLGDMVVAKVLAVGPPKNDLGSVIEPPCEVGTEILFPAGAGFNATAFLKYERWNDIPADDCVIVLKFEDVVCTVSEE